MKKASKHEDSAMRTEYDFSSAVKNPYATPFELGSNIVMIKPELFVAFPSEKAVNDALERLMQIEPTATPRRPASRSVHGVRSR